MGKRDNQQSLLKYFKNPKPGVSLLIAIIFAGVLMLISAGLAKVTIETYSNIRRGINGRHAYDLTVSANNMGRAAAYYGGVGYSASGKLSDESHSIVDILYEEYPGMDPGEGEWRIIGRSTWSMEAGNFDGMYLASPLSYHYDRAGGHEDVLDDGEMIVATGDAAEECKVRESLDDPCHWNKLKFDQPVVIPLYYTADSVLGEDDLNVLKVRIRPPCVGAKNGVTECTEDGRDKIEEPGRNDWTKFVEDPTIVRWQITGTDAASGKSVSMLAWDARYDPRAAGTNPDPTKRWVYWVDENRHRENKNSELFQSYINNPKYFKETGLEHDDHVVINADRDIPNDLAKKGNERGKILRGTEDVEEGYIMDLIKSLEEPMLILHLVRRVHRENAEGDDFGEFMPYLEYQVLVDRPVGDGKTVVESRGYAGNSMRIEKTERYWPVPAGGFALSY